MENFSAITVRAIANMYKYIISHPVDGMYVWMDEKNIASWYVLIYNIVSGDGAFDNGEYLIKFTIGKDFPHTPPSAEFLTPNGIYQVGGRFCVSIGEFHSQNYRPDIGIDGYALAVKGSFMDRSIFNDSPGIRIDVLSLDECKYLAAASKEYNKQHHGEVINEMIKLHNVNRDKVVPDNPVRKLTLRERMELKKMGK